MLIKDIKDRKRNDNVGEPRKMADIVRWSKKGSRRYSYKYINNHW